MSLCVQCGQSTFGGESLCAYHSASYGEEWARGNRIMCDFLHRGIVSPPERCAAILTMFTELEPAGVLH